VNTHVLADGDRVTLVDCGVWRPEIPGGGVAAVGVGFATAWYAMRDASRIVVTHAQIDHFGLAGNLIGAEVTTHRFMDLEKYLHPDTGGSPATPHVRRPWMSEAECVHLADHLTRWLPYLLSVLEASRRLRIAVVAAGVTALTTRVVMPHPACLLQDRLYARAHHT
jgi:glyoxylase-like metal-dependent hydrolase (beta-lactamase superfamily II)